MPDRAERLANLSDEYVTCRAIGHRWTFELGYGWRDPGGVEHRNDGWERRTCDRCGMAAERHYDRFFALLGTRYTPPKGYVLNGAGRGDWRAEARRELFVRRVGPPPRRRQRR